MLTTVLVAVSLAVPYLAQTEALCGGAAAAMVFRYWGDTHADAQQFAPLVDKRAGGIADDVLVRAIEERGWRSFRFAGSVDRLGEQLAKGRPVMILVADRAPRNHYLLVTGIESGAVLVHDPTWGPSRRIAFDDLMRVWRPTGFWSLVILPADGTAPTENPVEAAPLVSHDRCDRLLDDTIADAGGRPLGAAYEMLDGVRMQCPGEAGPLREMAGVRFAENRWGEAEALAERATGIDPTDSYAWEVLASSRFVQDDRAGALRAWNRIGKPLVNLVKIDGLERSRFQTVATSIGVWPNMLLTDDAFRLAERRLQELPGHAQSRLTFQPEPDGFVTVRAAVVERGGMPSGAAAWAASGIRTTVEREARVAIPGFTGQGEVWTAGWRWWSERPRVDFGFTAPGVGRVGGVWRLHASWESQKYGSGAGEERTHGAISQSDWLTADVRYTLTAGIDSWRGASYTGRTLFAGGALERRWSDDRWSLAGTATFWTPPSGGATFHTAGASAAFRSTRADSGWVHLADLGVERTSDRAPLALWPRAGEGHSGSVLMRAHPLIDDGIIDPGNTSAFGRTLAFAHGEIQRWTARTGPARVGVAVFADTGRASRRREDGAEHLLFVDVGAGLRVRVPGVAGTLRVDVAHSVLDEASALTAGWQF